MLADSQQEIGIHYWEVGKLSSSYCSQICACNTSNGIPFINHASGDPCLVFTWSRGWFFKLVGECTAAGIAGGGGHETSGEPCELKGF